MTREDIIRMAREASSGNDDRNIFFDLIIDELEAFATLVASAAVRETSAEYRLGWNDGQIAEREACAKIAETPVGEYEVVVACGTEPAPYLIPRYLNWQDIVTTIRARGQA